MNDILSILSEIFSMFGFLIRIAGFLLIGIGLGRFLLDNYPRSNWQLQIALVLGFFGLLIGLTYFATPGSSGAFAIGVGIAFLYKKKAGTDATLVDENKK